jgi:hypothetical protein
MDMDEKEDFIQRLLAEKDAAEAEDRSVPTEDFL